MYLDLSNRLAVNRFGLFERTARGQEGASESAADQQSREDKIARVERSEVVTIEN